MSKSNHPEASLRKGSKPQHKDPAKVVKGLGGINPADDPSDRNASTRVATARSNEEKDKREGAHGSKSNHNTATLRDDRTVPVIKAKDLGKVVSGLSTSDLPRK